MELKESKESTLAQEAFSVTLEVTGEYLLKIAFIEFPWLNIPVVKQIFSYVIKKMLSKIQSEGELMISFSFIDSETEVKRKKYEDSINQLKSVLSSDLTQEKKDEVIEETKKRLRDLIRFPVK